MDCHLLLRFDHEKSPHYWGLKNLDVQTSLHPDPLCLPLQTFNLSSLEPPGSVKCAENRTQNHRRHEQSSAFGGGVLGADVGRRVRASEEKGGKEINVSETVERMRNYDLNSELEDAL